MIKYFFIGGAYAESYWTQATAPDTDQWSSWKCGELVIVKMVQSASALVCFEPTGVDEWKEIPQIDVPQL